MEPVRRRSRAARREPLLDRALGTSRRRRQVAYAAFGAGYSLLRPTVRRVATAVAFGGSALAVLAVVAVLTWW